MISTKNQKVSREIKNKAYKYQDDIKQCHGNFDFQMIHSKYERLNLDTQR